MTTPSLSEREAARAGIQKAASRMIGRYVTALSLIALLSLTAFIGTRQIIHEQDESSTVINLSGWQRTLAQKIAHFALRMVVDEDPTDRAAARANLAHAIDLMERSHRALIHGDAELGLKPETRPQLRAMYYAPPLELDILVSDFLLSASSLVAQPDGLIDRENPDLQRVLDVASGPLIDALNEAVHRYEVAAKEQVDELRQTELLIFLVTLLVLMLEAIFIFRPMVSRIRLEASRFLKAQDVLERMAHHDELTGLPNRTLLQIHLEIALAEARRNETMVAVLQLDLDHFKDINDTMGHPAGDHLLCEVGRRLEHELRATDTVARLGGDEFALVLTGIAGARQAKRVAEKIVATIARPVRYGSQTINASASIGIALFPLDDDDPERLLKNADIALYQAKANGRNTFTFFASDMRVRIERRAQLENDLRRALDGDEFELYYQPILEIESRRVVAVEALLRWRHPKKGLLSPAEFLSVAEDTGLIVPIGYAMLERAGRLIKTLDAELPGAPLRLAVNLAGPQLRAQGFLPTFDALLFEVGIPHERIEVEITESLMLERGHEKITAVLDELRQRGVTLALDDFGTGHASLTYLKRIKVDRLKIDASFVVDIGTAGGDMTIVRALTRLGHSLALEVTAEGVETEEQLAFLKTLECDLGQGYLFGRPVPGAELASALRELDTNTPQTPDLPKVT